MTQAKHEHIAKLARAAKRNPERNFPRLYKAVWDDSCYIALGIVSNETDAQDVAQRALIKVYENISSLDNPQAAQKWINRIVSNEALNHLRSVKRQMTHLTGMDMLASEESFSPDAAANQEAKRSVGRHYLPEEFVDEREVSLILFQLIGELAPKQRQAVMLYYFADFSVPEIAEALGEKELTIRGRLFQARENLQKRIDEFERSKNVTLRAATSLSVGTLLKLNEICLPQLTPPGKEAWLSKLLGKASFPRFAVCMSAAGIIAVSILLAVILANSGQKPQAVLAAQEEIAASSNEETLTANIIDEDVPSSAISNISIEVAADPRDSQPDAQRPSVTLPDPDPKVPSNAQLTAGDIVTFSDLRWQVLKVDTSSALLLSEQSVQNVNWVAADSVAQIPSFVYYDQSLPRQWLRTEFSSKLNTGVLRKMGSGDYASLLSMAEIIKYLPTPADRAIGTSWWTSSNSSLAVDAVATIQANGTLGHVRPGGTASIRPAVIMDLSRAQISARSDGSFLAR